MHVVSLSLDPHVLNPESVVASRSRGYGEVLDSFTIIVPNVSSEIIQLSPKVVVMGTGGGNKLVQLWRLYQLVRQAVIAGKCEVITSQDTYFLAFLGYLLARRYHLGLEVQILGIEKLNWFRQRLMYFTINHASQVRLLSNSIKHRLQDEFGLAHERMTVVPIFTDVSSLAFDTSSLSDVERAIVSAGTHDFQASYGDYFNFVTISRLVPVKNISLQLRAIAQLKAKYPDIRLHVVGDGPLRTGLEDLAKELEIGSQVIFHGAKYGSELSPFFTETDCFVLTSHSEGWGMVVVEAATAGLPVIMTEVGCAGEVIKDGESGIIIKDNDLSALTAAMTIMMSDPEQRQVMGAAAKRDVANLPSFAEVRAQYLASWQAALNSKL